MIVSILFSVVDLSTYCIIINYFIKFKHIMEINDVTIRDATYIQVTPIPLIYHKIYTILLIL